MPKRVSQTELDAIKQVISCFSDAISIDEIQRALGLQMARRTLQRRLALLVEKGELLSEGKNRGSKYRLPPTPMQTYEVEAGGSQYVSTEVYIPVSPQGEQIKLAVRQPVQQRQPVGYNRNFLTTYQPNVTHYLSNNTRKHLLKIGQCQQKALPAGTYILQIYNRLLIDLTWNSSRLEGNTYSLLETQRLVELGENAEGKGAFETQMILNHKAAIELLVESAEQTGFNHYTLCNLHALLSENLLPDPAACGRLREQSVGIGGSVFHPLQGRAVITECFGEVLKKASAINDPFEQAFFAMVQLPYLQPFDDVNKRVSRLAANIPLIRDNLSPLSFVDVPEKAYIDGLLGIYELNRTELMADVFVWAYERSCARYSAVRQSLGEPDSFRLKYRESIARLVIAVVKGARNKQVAVSLIRSFAEDQITPGDRSRFVEIVETELMSLHEGNIARYRLRLTEFESWKVEWR
ncbi:Fic family protein [Porticoccus sp. GXU_MW_L64]